MMTNGPAYPNCGRGGQGGSAGAVVALLAVVVACGLLVSGLAELALSLSGLVGKDARGPWEGAPMSAAPSLTASVSFADAWDSTARRNEIHDGLRVSRAPAAPAGSDGDDVAVGPAEAAALAGVQEHLDANGISAETLAKALDVRPNVIRALLESPATIPLEHRTGLVLAAAKWVAEDAARREQRRTAYVATACTRTVVALARVVRETHVVGLLTGGAGYGKSHAAEALAAELPGRTTVVRVDPDSRGAKGILAALGRAASAGLPGALPSVKLGLDAARRGNGLIVADEAQLLGLNGLEALRAIFDGAGVGVLLLGTTALGKTVSAAGDPLCGPLVSRVALRVDLDRELRGPDGRRPWIDARTLGDILARAVAGEASRDAARLLLQTANEHAGHLRAALDAARVAAALSRTRQRDAGQAASIEASDVEQALRWRGGE